jgi:hypothetical protein
MFTKILERWHRSNSFSIHKEGERAVPYYEYFYCTMYHDDTADQSMRTYGTSLCNIVCKFKDNKQNKVKNIL